MRERQRHVVSIGILLAAAAAALAADAGRQQRQGEPFTTAITKVKEGLFVIPGYDGAATGGNVAVRVTRRRGDHRR
jgi:hypothetical protein